VPSRHTAVGHCHGMLLHGLGDRSTFPSPRAGKKDINRWWARCVRMCCGYYINDELILKTTYIQLILLKLALDQWTYFTTSGHVTKARIWSIVYVKRPMKKDFCSMEG